MSKLRIGRRQVHGAAYLRGVDGLRAIAVLTVMIFHLVPAALPGGFVGVDVFFVISGYVVTNSMLGQRDRSLGAFISGFYARRFRRIVPPLVLCLCVMIPISFAVIPDAWLSTSIPTTALSAFFGASNIALIVTNDGYFATQAGSNPFTHTWSLGVEEQFYLIFPLLLYGAVHRSRGRVTIARGVLVALGVLSVGYSVWATAYAPSAAYYLLPSRFWELAMGAAAAMAGEARRKAVVDRIGHAPLMNAGMILIAGAAIFANEHLFPMPWAIPACAGALAIILASGFAADRRSLGAIVENPLAVTIGLLSYALYLWHWPIYTVMRWTVGLDRPSLYLMALLLTALAAWLSYQLVEYPMQNWRFFRNMRPAATIAAGLTVVMAGFGASRFVYHHPARFKITEVARNADEWYPGGGGMPGGRACDVVERQTGNGLTEISPTRCIRSLPPGPRIFAIGDSHAGAYARMLRTVVSETGDTVVIASAAGCGEADFITPVAALPNRCPRARGGFINGLVGRLKPHDIVFLASLRSVRLSDQDGPVPAADIARRTTSTIAAERRDAARKEALATIDRLSATGASIVLDLPLPVFKAPPFRCSDWFNAANSTCAPGLTISAKELAAMRGPVVSAMVATARGRPNVYLWNPFPILCPADPCSAMRAGRPLFFDGDHLSGYGNELLAPSFVALIKQIEARPAEPATV